MWAFFNTSDGCSYIYDGHEWTLLAAAGSGGSGIQSNKFIVSYALESDDYSDIRYDQRVYTLSDLADGRARVLSAYDVRIWKNNYTLSGWRVKTSYNQEDVIAFETPLSSVFEQYGNEIILVPVWTLTRYRIHYNVVEGCVLPHNPDSFTIEDDVVLEKCTLNGIEYDWIMDGRDDICTGWNAGEYANDVWLRLKDVHIINYNIDYTGSNAVNNPNNPRYYLTGETVTLYAPSREGYDFAGWYLWDNYLGNSDVVIWTPEGDWDEIYLTAKWTSPMIESIVNMTESGTVAITGALTDSDMCDIRDALCELYNRNTEIEVSLDFSGATGVNAATSNGELRANFYGCSALVGITLSSSFTAIESFAYTHLRSINIPDSVMWIGQGAFEECRYLESVTFETDDKWEFKTEHGFEYVNTSGLTSDEIIELFTHTYLWTHWQRVPDYHY